MRIPTVSQPARRQASVGPLATNGPSPPAQGQGSEPQQQQEEEEGGMME